MDEIYVTTWKCGRWLVVSSLFFLIPALYAYYNKLYLYSGILCMSSCISANFWRKATYSFRRNADLFFSKITFAIFVVNGFVHVRRVSYICTGYPGLILLLYCYYLSAKLIKQQNSNWYLYHMAFHLIGTYEYMIILHSIILP